MHQSGFNGDVLAAAESHPQNSTTPVSATSAPMQETQQIMDPRSSYGPVYSFDFDSSFVSDTEEDISY